MRDSNFVPWVYTSKRLPDLYRELADCETEIEIKSLNIRKNRSNVPVGHLVFKYISSPRSTVNRLIDYESHDQFREAAVRAFLEIAWMSDYSFEAFRGSVGSLRSFLNFSDARDTSNLNALPYLAQQFTDHLVEQSRLNRKDKSLGFSSATASTKQRLVIKVIEQLIGFGSCDHIRRIRTNKLQHESVLPPYEHELASHLNHYTYLYVEISKRLMSSTPLPWLMNVADTEFYVFPFRGHMTKLQEKTTGNFNNIGFNYENGQLRTFSQIKSILLFSTEMSERKIWLKAYHHHRLTRRIIRETNKSVLCKRKKFFALLAIRSYLNHFLIITGMNDCTAATLDLNDIKIFRGKRKFRAIKARAGGRVVEFEIQNIFMKYFDAYLEFREFVLKELGAKTSKLFFDIPQRGDEGITEMRDDGKASNSTHKMNPFSSLVPHITSRRYRVHKGQWVAKRNGIDVASFSLQHQPGTNRNHYNNADQETVDQELTFYYSLLRKRAVKSYLEHEKETVSGNCHKFNSPTELSAAWRSFRPDCETFQGCVFCEHYSVHADEVDVRKLISMKFIAECYLRVSSGAEVYLKLIHPLVKRVDQILSDIADIGNEHLIKSLTEDVYLNENLSSYWAEKYELLDELGVI